MSQKCALGHPEISTIKYVGCTDSAVIKYLHNAYFGLYSNLLNESDILGGDKSILPFGDTTTHNIMDFWKNDLWSGYFVHFLRG